jgi:hypothetical protein
MAYAGLMPRRKWALPRLATPVGNDGEHGRLRPNHGRMRKGQNLIRGIKLQAVTPSRGLGANHCRAVGENGRLFKSTGAISDCTGAAALLSGLPSAQGLPADRGYAAGWFGEGLANRRENSPPECFLILLIGSNTLRQLPQSLSLSHRSRRNRHVPALKINKSVA